MASLNIFAALQYVASTGHMLLAATVGTRAVAIYSASACKDENRL
ncbi:MAG TPA: hypothetical protein VK129_02695 [Terriglobales bacterium]|nr:hypothetical protein [Terriglobales bacterium]